MPNLRDGRLHSISQQKTHRIVEYLFNWKSLKKVKTEVKPMQHHLQSQKS
jgi:hypothetical protein